MHAAAGGCRDARGLASRSALFLLPDICMLLGNLCVQLVVLLYLPNRRHLLLRYTVCFRPELSPSPVSSCLRCPQNICPQALLLPDQCHPIFVRAPRRLERLYPARVFCQEPNGVVARSKMATPPHSPLPRGSYSPKTLLTEVQQYCSPFQCQPLWSCFFNSMCQT